LLAGKKVPQREGYPPAILDSALAISAYQRAEGKTLTITSVIADLTGRPPRTFGDFVRDHVAAFSPRVRLN
jgi:hypothetical protein